MIRVVVFDVGETLVDETRNYAEWADWLGVARHTFSAVFGAAISAGKHQSVVYEHFRPGIDMAVERQRRARLGQPESIREEDLYADARGCMEELKSMGLRVGIARNRKTRDNSLESLNLPVDMIASSGEWGVSKPDPGFFRKLIDAAGIEAGEIMYVGDRVDRDIIPAKATGLRTAWIRRGPWANIWSGDPDVNQADWRLDSLMELPALIAADNTSQMP